MDWKFFNFVILESTLFYFSWIAVYDALTGESIKTLKNQNSCVRDVSWHPYLNEIVSSSWDCSVMKWRYEDESELQNEQCKPPQCPISLRGKRKILKLSNWYDNQSSQVL